MGSKTINPVGPALTGASLTKTDSGGTTSSIVIAATTAQSSLNLSTMAVVFENYSSTASFTVSLGAADDYSEKGQGAAATITVGTEASIIIGGKSMESARFLTDDDQLVFTITTAATCYVYSVMVPFIVPNQ